MSQEIQRMVLRCPLALMIVTSLLFEGTVCGAGLHVSLAWEAPLGVEPEPLYNVYRRTDKGSWLMITPEPVVRGTIARPFEDVAPSLGTNIYAVTAVRPGEEDSESEHSRPAGVVFCRVDLPPLTP